MKNEGWIDAHVHIWPENEKSNPRRFTAAELLAHARANGVGRIVLIQPGMYRFDNSYMLDAIRRYKGVFSGVAVVETAAGIAKMKGAGVRGFRVTSGFETGGMRDMWRAAGEQRLAMCPLINPAAFEAVGKLCAEFPQTRVVIDHLGRIGADGQIRETDVASLCALARHKGVHVKVSAFYALGKKQPPYDDLAPLIKRVFESFGAQRLMWATDGPYQTLRPHTYAASLELVRDRLDFLHREDRDWILRGTAERVFF